MSNYVVNNVISNSYHDFYQEKEEKKEEKKVEEKKEEQDPDIDRCFICFETYGKLIKPCKCQGTNYSVHRKCLNKWIKTSKIDYCQICKYKYKYELILKPSCKRFYNKNFDCYQNISLVDDNLEDLTDDTNHIFFFSMFFYLPIYLITTITIFLNYDLLLIIYWSFFIFKPIIYFILKFKLYFNLDLPKIIRNTQLLLCFVTFIVINIILSDYETRCRMNCRYDLKSCNNNCSYFENLNKAKKSQVILINNRLITLGLTILFDFLIKLKYLFFNQRIAEYIETQVYLSKIYPKIN